MVLRRLALRRRLAEDDTRVERGVGRVVGGGGVVRRAARLPHGLPLDGLLANLWRGALAAALAVAVAGVGGDGGGVGGGGGASVLRLPRAQNGVEEAHPHAVGGAVDVAHPTLDGPLLWRLSVCAEPAERAQPVLPALRLQRARDARRVVDGLVPLELLEHERVQRRAERPVATLGEEVWVRTDEADDAQRGRNVGVARRLGVGGVGGREERRR